MPRYTLDTQHFIDVLKGRPTAVEVLDFLRVFVAAVDLHAVVSAELLIGAHGRGEPNAIRKRFIDRFKPHRVIIPDDADLFAAGDAIRKMSERWGPHPELAQRNFWNDVIIATSCRRRGVVLLSRDPDHERIAAFVGHTHRSTFPASA